MVLRRVGILGGTFDPVHRGHLEIARHAIDEAGLERVVFVPAGQPRLKSGAQSASAEERLEMIRLAVEGNPGFNVSDIEVGRSGSTLTVETLTELSATLDAGVEMVFILGLDVLARFDEWVEPESVVELALLLAVDRAGYAGFDWDGFYARNPYARGRVECIHSTAVDVSASELRSRLAAGSPVSGLIPEQVERFIREKGLYGTE